MKILNIIQVNNEICVIMHVYRAQQTVLLRLLVQTLRNEYINVTECTFVGSPLNSARIIIEVFNTTRVKKW